MSEKKAKIILTQLLQQSGLKHSADDLISFVKKPKDTNSKKKLIALLKQITNNLPFAAKHIEEFNQNFKTKDAYESFIEFLTKLSDEKKMSTPILRSNVIETQILPPTKIIERITPQDLTNIRERVVQAASGGLSKSAQGNTGLSTLSISSTPVTCRTSSLWDFNCLETFPYQQINAAAIPITGQESIILTEIIYCLVGIRGSYIVPEAPIECFDPIRFKVSDQIQSSLRDIVQQVLPLASHYSQVQRFIQHSSSPSCGQVLQALSSALRTLTNDYYMSIVQLEPELLQENLSLHKLLFFLRPTMTTMEVLADSVITIGKTDIRGGKVLTLLHDKITSLTGDQSSQKILIHLTQMAAAPYMEILQLWILKGVIDDPQQEFLVEDNEIIRREELPEHYSADYWEKRYTISRERIPRFLEKLSDLILRTGKYLNVIRQCGKNVIPPLTSSISFSHMDQNYVTFINNAYHFASRTLLELLIKENDLMGHLLSVKRYFLLQQGDFIAQFMDACEQELFKNVDQVLPMRLENLLEITLRLSSAKHDPYNDDLKTELLPYDLVTQMSKIIENEEEYWQAYDKIDLTGLECFAFRYDVKWPVSLVLNHIAISKYQMLFRQLFYCKHVERQLCRVWVANNNAKKFAPETAELYRSAFTLRQRMMNAVQNIEYYMMIEVIEPNWHIFIENMNRVENVDDVLIVHQDFLDLCLKNCMLTDPSLLRTIIKLCTVCLSFCEFIQGESSLAPCDTFSERVKRFDLEFTGLLIGLLKRINDVASVNPSDKFINLVHRINFNSYYSDQLELLCAKDSMISQF